MPAVVIPALISAATVGGIGTFSWVAFGASLVMSGAARLLTPSMKAGGGVKGLTTNIKQALMNRKPVYGELRIGDATLFVGSTDNNKYLHIVMAVAPHEVTEIGEVWLNDQSIPLDYLDASGNVTSGRYAGYCRIKKHLGSTSQSADSDLVAEITGWDSTHKLSGIAYVYVRLLWKNSIFPTGIPNITAWVRGKSIIDTRDSTTKFTSNISLICNDYLRDTEFGLGATSAEIDSTTINAAANTCEEIVTVTAIDTTVSAVTASTDIITLSGEYLKYQRGDRVEITTTGAAPAGLSVSTSYYVIPYQRKTTPRLMLATSLQNARDSVAINITDAGTGTHTIRKTGEPRYSGAIQIDSGNPIGENIKDILSGMGGKIVYAGGKYLVQPAVYNSPTIYFDESDLISQISVQTKISARERFNTVRGTYINPALDGQPADYPEVTNATYVTEDGGEKIVKPIDYPATQRPHTCQRLSKIELEKMRQEITWNADFNLTAFQVQAGDVAYFSNTRMGWTNKAFEIMNWKLSSRADSNGVPVPFISMQMRETASGVYDWAAGEETTVDLAPNTTLPDAFTVAAITGLAVDNELVETTTAGTSTYKILISWALPTDQFVVSGGKVELQFKKSADSDWRSTYVAPGDINFSEVTLAAKLNTPYDLRARAVNNMGVKSEYTSITNFNVGSSGSVGTTNDWGNWVEAVGPTADWSNWVDAVGTSYDWEYYT